MYYSEEVKVRMRSTCQVCYVDDPSQSYHVGGYLATAGEVIDMVIDGCAPAVWPMEDDA